jgi:hypothetical protein
MKRNPKYEVKVNAAKSVILMKRKTGWQLSLPDNEFSGTYFVHIKRLTDNDLRALAEVMARWSEDLLE